MTLKDTCKKMKALLCEVCDNLDKAEGGNKAAAQRVRTASIKLEKVAKLYRKESVKADKGPKKRKSAPKKKAAVKSKPVSKKKPAAKKKAAPKRKTAPKLKSPAKRKPTTRKRATAKVPKRRKKK